MQAMKHASKGITLALKPRADITRGAKQGYQWPHKRTYKCPSNCFLKNKRMDSVRLLGTRLTIKDLEYDI